MKRWCLWSALVVAIAGVLATRPASATTTLTVDLSSTLGPVAHVASGSLYGVTETVPADVNGLIAPLHPNVFNNPAADVQQPDGDAIVVAGRLAPLGARVSIRLADWFPNWPYAFTSMTDWFSKLGMTVSRRKAANLTNIYAYEIWNEPDGTWKSTSLAFNDFWKQTYDQLRQLDPGIKITGPSISFFSQSYLQSFLSFCKTNDCLPDIVGWHELSGGNITGNIQAYRNLETQLGIGPLPISINEYSGPADITVEGQPGASAPMIAKLERFRVDSACISYWDVAHPGRLGSLLATNTDPNGGWWFYKWYGDMAGNMVATTPPTPSSVSALDGFANVDSTARKASVLFGGTNDGTIQIVVKGFSAAVFFGARVHAVVEHTPWTNRTTIVRATDVVSTSDVTIASDQIAISVPGTNGTDGYRLSLTPVGGGGAGGAGGSTGAGGMSGAGGSTGAGGGGTGGAAGHGQGGGSGGRADGVGGNTVVAGTGGAPGTGGATGTGGRGTVGGTGGSAVAGTGGAGAGGAGTGGSATTDQSGCSCGVTTGAPRSAWAIILAAAGAIAVRRRVRAGSQRNRTSP